MRGTAARDLVFIDESGVNLALTRLHARSPKGTRAHGSRPHKRGKSVSLISAWGLKGLLTTVNIMGSVNGMTFEAFVAAKLVPRLWPGACVILDNCSIHKPSVIRELIHAAGAKLIYLPPYSPDFSPIENGFSKLKATLRKLEARTYPALVEAIENAWNDISLSDVRNWFTHCVYCTPED